MQATEDAHAGENDLIPSAIEGPWLAWVKSGTEMHVNRKHSAILQRNDHFVGIKTI